MIEQAVKRGHRPGLVVSQLTELLSDYGAAELETAIVEALAQQVPYPQAVQQVLECRREQRNEPPPIAVPLSGNKAGNVVIRPASLQPYDQLGKTKKNNRAPSEADKP